MQSEKRNKFIDEILRDLIIELDNCNESNTKKKEKLMKKAYRKILDILHKITLVEPKEAKQGANNIQSKVYEYLTTVDSLDYLITDYDYINVESNSEFIEILKESRKDFIYEIPERFENFIRGEIIENNTWLYELGHELTELNNAYNTSVNLDIVNSFTNKYMNEFVVNDISNWLDFDKFIYLLRQNEYIKHKLDRLDVEKDRRAKEQKKKLHKKMLDRIPDRYPDLYPEARAIKRHFILHIGGTNSGKTYSALQALKEAGQGICLFPLRLLAYEKYVELNSEGYSTNLITGEETKVVENAVFQASTIEVCDYSTYYKCAVVDEVQMLEDKERGCQWSGAILGLCASEIHLCLAPIAKDLVIRLIEDCNDTYEIIEHERRTPLEVFNGIFSFPNSVKEHDALIVFSRKNVHAVAAELLNYGLKPSIIYGALPYDVRQEEARKFRDGETNIVVATDAIGMGMNLPIERVCVLEVEKFDGVEKRRLDSEELKQIIGRAGRFGMYPIGYYTGDKEVVTYIGKILKTEHVYTKDAYLKFPDTLLGIDSDIVSILNEWKELQAKDGYIPSNVEREIKLAEELKPLTTDKNLIYSLITIPYDETDKTLHDIWIKECTKYIKYNEVPKEIDIKTLYVTFDSNVETSMSLLETNSKILDLYYQLLNKMFASPSDIDRILDYKLEISKLIMKALEHKELEAKHCKDCGATLPWNYPHGMCDSCFHKIRAKQRARLK